MKGRVALSTRCPELGRSAGAVWSWPWPRAPWGPPRSPPAPQHGGAAGPRRGSALGTCVRWEAGCWHRAVPREVAPSRDCGGQRGFLAGGPELFSGRLGSRALCLPAAPKPAAPTWALACRVHGLSHTDTDLRWLRARGYCAAPASRGKQGPCPRKKNSLRMNNLTH